MGTLGRLLRLAALVPLAHAAITLESPRDYQVFQRTARNSGAIEVRGRAAAPCGAGEVRVGRRRASLKIDPATCAFRGEVTAAAGGWYAVHVRVGKAKVVTPHVGVGEVFVIAGQSNSTNWGEELQMPRSGMVSTFSGTEWRPADDPQPGVQDGSRRGSFIPAFGDALAARLKVPVGVACVGYGGTSVRQWLPKGDRFRSPPTNVKYFVKSGPDEWQSDGRLFDGLLERIHQLGRFRALLWHQGESDAHQGAGHELTGAQYRRMMERLIGATRAATMDFPWMVAQVSYHSPSDPADPAIRAAQASLWKDGIALEGPDTDTLTGDNREDGGGGIHLSGKGLEAHGRMWAEKVGQWISQRW